MSLPVAVPVLADLAYWQVTVIRAVSALVAVLLVAGMLVYVHLFIVSGQFHAEPSGSYGGGPLRIVAADGGDG